MKILEMYRFLLFLIPFLVLGYAAVTAFPQELNRNRFLAFLDSLNERDMGDLLANNGFSADFRKGFSLLRVIFPVLLGALLWPLKRKSADLLWILGSCLVFYKSFYFAMRLKERKRLKELNRMLPYDIRIILYLSYLYPVSNAFEKAPEYVHTVFTQDLKQLLRDIDADPLSFGPYQKFIDRYDGKLDQLQFYLRILYRMNHSSAGAQKRLLANLNDSLSHNIAIVRSEKNQNTNRVISYLGMIPVILVSMMLTYLLIRFSNTI